MTLEELDERLALYRKHPELLGPEEICEEDYKRISSDRYSDEYIRHLKMRGKTWHANRCEWHNLYIDVSAL